MPVPHSSLICSEPVLSSETLACAVTDDLGLLNFCRWLSPAVVRLSVRRSRDW